jgi:hypothetical protein
MEKCPYILFKNLYSKDDSINPHGVTDLVECVDEAMKRHINDALFHIGPLKALGPYGTLFAAKLRAYP